MSMAPLRYQRSVQFLRGDKVLEPVRSANGWNLISQVKGQQHVKRVVEVAAAGGHISSRLDLFTSGTSPSFVFPLSPSKKTLKTKQKSSSGNCNVASDFRIKVLIKKTEQSILIC